MYHLRLVGGPRPAVDRVRVSPLLPPGSQGAPGRVGGPHTAFGAPPQLITRSSGYRHRPGNDQFRSTEGGKRSPREGPLLPGSPSVFPQNSGDGRRVTIQANGVASDQTSPLVEYSAGHMYFSPRMLFVGEDHRTEVNTSLNNRSRTPNGRRHTHGDSGLAVGGISGSSSRDGPVRAYREPADRVSPPEQHHRLPRTVESGRRPRQGRRARPSRPAPDATARSRSRHQSAPQSTTQFLGAPRTSRRHRSASSGGRGARRYSPRLHDLRYREESECPRTVQDPDGDCIRGEAGGDYPTLESVPRTEFSCQGRPAGFYADVETRCQVRDRRLTGCLLMWRHAAR